jgi:hypothetical protein
MELKSPQALRFQFPADTLKEFYCGEFPQGFAPSRPVYRVNYESYEPSLVTVDLCKMLDWLHSEEKPRDFENEICEIPILLYVSDFSLKHLLFHYDGTQSSADLIRKFIRLFGNLIGDSMATIISPCFIVKSKLREEQEIIQLVSQSTQETSFIKFNFLKIGDFWSYGVKHDCTLLITAKNYQADLAKVLFYFYRGKIWSNRLSFYLSV